MSSNVKLLHPHLQKIIPKFLEECKKQGLIVKVTDTLRTKKEQNILYEKGRTLPGKIVTWVKYPHSNHNWGIAFDICRNDGKGAYNDSDNWFFKVGQIGKKFGLSWGGDWNPKDKPHFELIEYGTTNNLIEKYGSFENFKKTWGYGGEEYMFVERKYKYNNKTKTYNVINEKGQNYIKIIDVADLLNKDICYDENTKTTFLKDR
ncbi:M15 family metallopeptidase [uncultured Tyzzerella sp.]|uniref:M15 family metallopeptidase n=1 Tax=uncultured Tyzzerella sp. TaxID=2321398 RepID=UPI002943A9DF|nr:M15 family metallopeptidase [uncultured Tyzzerella sp.]